ncbi:MAG: hypothetical protein AB1589_39960 [Cyanobacteriota bacterium]
MSWITYKITSETHVEFTHFSKLNNLGDAQAEWEMKFRQKAISVVLDSDNNEIDLSDLFEEE